ncbi:MAG: dTMP kinase [Candidatus Altiarchaeota archaeon]
MFIVLEGVDGSGKSTHARLLADWLRGRGKGVFLTMEPTDGKIGKLIREVLSGRIHVDPKALALLFCADRVEHVRQINEALSKGDTVISDRYFHSTVAYQAAQGVDRNWLIQLNRFVIEPDLVILLDVDPAAGADRARSGEIFEKSDFLDKVRVGYLRFKEIKVVDSSKDKDAVQEEIRSIVHGCL